MVKSLFFSPTLSCGAINGNTTFFYCGLCVSEVDVNKMTFMTGSSSSWTKGLPF